MKLYLKSCILSSKIKVLFPIVSSSLTRSPFREAFLLCSQDPMGGSSSFRIQDSFLNRHVFLLSLLPKDIYCHSKINLVCYWDNQKFFVCTHNIHIAFTQAKLFSFHSLVNGQGSAFGISCYPFQQNLYPPV